MKLKYLLWAYLGMAGIFCSCQKGEEFVKPVDGKTIRLSLQGYVMLDTLEFLKEGKVICEAYETNFNMMTPEGRPIVSATGLQVRKKGSTTILDTLSIKQEPFDQVIKIFYDGNAITDNIEITPVSSPDKVGMRFSVLANSEYVTDGLVDVEIFEKLWTFLPDGSLDETYKSIYTVKNIGGDFSEFVELPAITFDDPSILKFYVFKVYQAGTKEPPFKDGVEFPGGPIENTYGDIFLTDGQSALFQVSYNFNENQFQMYNVDDIAFYFQ